MTNPVLQVSFEGTKQRYVAGNNFFSVYYKGRPVTHVSIRSQAFRVFLEQALAQGKAPTPAITRQTDYNVFGWDRAGVYRDNEVTGRVSRLSGSAQFTKKVAHSLVKNYGN